MLEYDAFAKYTSSVLGNELVFMDVLFYCYLNLLAIAAHTFRDKGEIAKIFWADMLWCLNIQFQFTTVGACK